MKNQTEFVKIPTKRKNIWLKVKFSKNGNPIVNGKMKGVSLKTKKEYSFYPSDAIAFYTGTIKEVEGLGMPYIPTADVCNILDTVVPDSMGYETHIATRIIQEKIGKGLREFVAEKLHYKEGELCKSLSAEQIDAVALCIYNIEYRSQGMIIGDQTGIGKGRVAAAMIRYGYYNALKPIFLSEKPNLFSDLYRDLADIDSAKLKPFIINSRDSKTNIKDKNGKIVFKALAKTEQDRIFKDRKFPAGYDFAVATYSQFNSVKKRPTKANFLRSISKKNLIIMDESHNASGSSNTGEFLQEVLAGTKGVVFLSATFAKRPDNMPVYAKKTSMREANMSSQALIEAIQKGGVALQEVLASQLVSEGQMLRRERSFEGVEVNYIILTEKEKEHRAIFDNITSVLRDIIQFQAEHIKGEIEQMDEIVKASGEEIETRKGTDKAGVDSQPYFSKVFQVINQMLFSIKASSVAYRTIERLKEGKKPVIAFSSTMESFIDKMQHDDGTYVRAGDTINLDYRIALQKGLDGVLRYTVTDKFGKRKAQYLDITTLSPEAQTEYYAIQEKINKISTGISLSPIDVIKDIVRNAGYTIDEVTGRKYEIQLIDGTNRGVLMNRKRLPSNDIFRMFNNNELDCIMINQSGSTGASAHAVPTDIVPPSEVKQRVMIVLQPELDINTEVQKRGRINRTGQIMKPIYDYVSSSIPAEQRLVMMLRKKLKSLDANTTSNQKQSSDLIESDDFLNKYGDKIVTDFLKENEDINDLLDDPLFLNKEGGKKVKNASLKVSGRVAVLTTEQQEMFYNQMIDNYKGYVKYLKQAGKYDLEIEALNFEAETKDVKTVIEGKNGTSVFSENTFMETVEVNNLKKPFTSNELENILTKNLAGENAKEIQENIVEDASQFYAKRLKIDIEKTNKKYDSEISDITKEKKYLKIPPENASLRRIYIEDRERELEEAREKKIDLLELKNRNQLGNIKRVLNFFYIGKYILYPKFEANVSAVCLGINIDKKKKNPYTPSAIKVMIAIASSDKYIDLTISGEPGQKLNDVMAHSINISYDEKNILNDWDYFCKDANVSRKDVSIVTGNILQAFAKYTGKLISFTTLDGSIRKGILMPDDFDAVKNQQNFISVPIDKAKDYVLQTEIGTFIQDSTKKISIIKEHYDEFSLSVPANAKFQNYYKDKKLIKLCNNERDGFERKSSKMIAYFTEKNLSKAIDYIAEAHSLSVLMSPSVYDDHIGIKTVVNVKSKEKERAEQVYEEDKEKFKERQSKKVSFQSKPKVDNDKQKRIRIAKVKAKAKLKMLKLRNL